MGFVMPEQQLCVARELTKKFEEFRRGIVVSDSENAGGLR